MQTRNFFLGAVLGSLLGVAAFSQPSPIQISAKSDQDSADRKSGVIQGQVLGAEGEVPLAEATVVLYAADGRGNEHPTTARTDDRGEYEFSDLKAGKYLVQATRNGYLRQSYGEKTSSGSGRQVGTPLSLASGQVLGGIDFELIRGGVVEGAVVDQHNEPRSQVPVTLCSYRTLRGERSLRPVRHDRTDDRGRFRLFDIPPGSYYLRADTPPVWGGSGEGDRAFPPTFYPGVLRPQDATKVEVAAGQEVGGFFFTLIETQTYSVGGRVLTADGKPAHTVWIMSRRESSNAYVFGMEASANTNLQGEFRVSGLLPGKHRIHARSGRNENPQMASAVVEVTDQDIEGLTLMPGAGAEVAGRIVTDRQDSDLDWRRIRLFMAPDSSANRGFFGGAGARVEEDFTFKVSRLSAGPYRFVVWLPRGNHYVSSVRIEGHDVTDRPIELRSDDRLKGVEVQVSSDGAQIRGVVQKDSAGEAVEGATVLVFAADSQNRGARSRFTKTAQTDQSGRFSLEGLVPAEYRICALTDHEPGRESELDYLSSLERDSVRIDLSPGQTVEESLVALPAAEMY